MIVRCVTEYCLFHHLMSPTSTARHLALCEGGRKSAYPSVLDAMVYHGDHVTGGPLSLANLGLSNITLSSILPSEASEVSTREPTIDMSHFMSISMEVDEDD